MIFLIAYSPPTAPRFFREMEFYLTEDMFGNPEIRCAERRGHQQVECGRLVRTIDFLNDIKINRG